MTNGWWYGGWSRPISGKGDFTALMGKDKAKADNDHNNFVFGLFVFGFCVLALFLVAFLFHCFVWALLGSLEAAIFVDVICGVGLLIACICGLTSGNSDSVLF